MKNDNLNNKKIDIVVKYFFPVTAGIEVNVMETYRRLVKKGWNVTIHTSNDTYLKKNHLPKKEVLKGILVKRYPFKWYGFFPNINYKNTTIIAMHNFDIFPHSHILLRILLHKILNKKTYSVCITPHGGFNPEWSVFPPIERLIKKSYHKTLGVALINLTANGVRAVSQWEKKEMIKEGINKKLVKVISNGIEDEAYMNVEKLATKEIKTKINLIGSYILQVGRVYEIKNYETTIKALSMLPKDIHYIIAGPIQDRDEYKKMLDSLIKSLNLEKRVHFFGVIKGVDKYYLIKHAEMMIHMALWESFCNVVHEGLSQGLVCMVANNTALPLLIKNGINGYCIETKNYKALAEKINFVLKAKNTKFIKDMKKRNKVLGLKNSWDDISERLRIFYKNLIIL